MSPDPIDAAVRPIGGIHHITAITGHAQANVDFYAGVLGMRLVKKTVNFDDPSAYHLYFGDGQGSPGSILTFFAWEGLPRGRRGAGQVIETAFSVPVAALTWWAERLTGRGIAIEEGPDRGKEPVIRFNDPEGLGLALVGRDGDRRAAWGGGPVPAEHGVRGFAGATLAVEQTGPTLALMTEVMGFRMLSEEGGRIRLAPLPGGTDDGIDLVAASDPRPGRIAVGSVHHIAWRVADDASQGRWRQLLLVHGLQATPVIDRQYFRSVYFREPGHILFELATDPPGFTVDEPLDALGQALRLPPWYESARDRIESALPPLTTAEAAHA